MLAMVGNGLSDLARQELGIEVNCLDRWLIAYSRGRSEHIAQHSLGHAHWECFYPLRKVVTMKPARSLPSKTRHRRRFEVVEKIEPVLGGYLFIRPLRRDCDISHLYELQGVGGICRLGDRIATLQDWEVELMRLAEADGKFNIYHQAVPGTYLVSMHIDPRPDFEKKQYEGKSRLSCRLDESEKTVQFRDELGRVLRFIHSTERIAAR